MIIFNDFQKSNLAPTTHECRFASDQRSLFRDKRLQMYDKYKRPNRNDSGVHCSLYASWHLARYVLSNACISHCDSVLGIVAPVLFLNNDLDLDIRRAYRTNRPNKDRIRVSLSRLAARLQFGACDSGADQRCVPDRRKTPGSRNECKSRFPHGNSTCVPTDTFTSSPSLPHRRARLCSVIAFCAAYDDADENSRVPIVFLRFHARLPENRKWPIFARTSESVTLAIRNESPVIFSCVRSVGSDRYLVSDRVVVSIPKEAEHVDRIRLPPPVSACLSVFFSLLFKL
jgi:hypothetical protein